MSLGKIVFTAVTVLGLFGCAGTDGQSTPGHGEGTATETSQSEGQAVNATPASTYLAQCNARCYANYTNALNYCEGDSVCVCFAKQGEGACLAQCAGRPYIRHAC